MRGQIDSYTRTENLFEFLPNKSNYPDENRDLKWIGFHKSKTDITIDKTISYRGIILIRVFIHSIQFISQSAIGIDFFDVKSINLWIVIRQKFRRL